MSTLGSLRRRETIRRRSIGASLTASRLTGISATTAAAMKGIRTSDAKKPNKKARKIGALMIIPRGLESSSHITNLSKYSLVASLSLENTPRDERRLLLFLFKYQSLSRRKIFPDILESINTSSDCAWFFSRTSIRPGTCLSVVRMRTGTADSVRPRIKSAKRTFSPSLTPRRDWRHT